MYVDAVYCYRPSIVWSVGWSVALSVCQSVILVSPAKMAAPIEMPFWLKTRVGSGNHVLDGSPDLPREGAILREKGASHCKVWGQFAIICAKTAETIEMPFGYGLGWSVGIIC